MSYKDELNGVIGRFNRLMAVLDLPYSINAQSRNNYHCIDLYINGKCEKMLSSFKTRKAAIAYIHALLTGISLLK